MCTLSLAKLDMGVTTFGCGLKVSCHVIYCTSWVLCIVVASAGTIENCLRPHNIRLNFFFLPCSEYENFLAFISIGTQLCNSSEREFDFLLLPDFSFSNWTYIVLPSLAELVVARMWIYFHSTF